MYTQVKINSIDVTAYCANWTFEKTYGDMLPEITLTFNRNINNVLTLSTGQTLEVYRGWITATDEIIFNGYIEKFEPESGLITVIGMDKLWDLVRKEVTHIYDSTIDASAGKVSEIFKDLVTTYGGLTADGTSIQDSGTSLTLNKFVCNHTDIFERCKALAEMLNWQFYYKASTDKVYFEPRGFTSNSTTFYVGLQIMNLPKWQNDITEMTNDVTIVGAYQEVETTKSGRIGTTSGFTTTDILLDYVPISVKVYGDAANPPTTLKTGGVVNSTTTYDYYVDNNQKKIYPKPSTTFTSGHYYEVRYSLAAPIPVNEYDQTSIDAYGRFKKTITYDDIKTVADAESRAYNYLAKYSKPFIFTTIKVKNDSTFLLDVGQNIQVIDNITVPNINGTFVINKLRIKYPAAFDEADIGDSYWRLADFNTTVMEKFKRTEEEELTNMDILNQIVDINNTIADPIVLTNRYIASYTQSVTGTDVFILDNTSFGVLGTNELGDAGVGVETVYAIQQYNNTYLDKIQDATFFLPESTATIDYTNKEVRF